VRIDVHGLIVHHDGRGVVLIDEGRAVETQARWQLIAPEDGHRFESVLARKQCVAHADRCSAGVVARELDVADAAVARGAMPALAPLCAAQGVELLDLMPMGWHNIYGRRPHRTPQSLEGVRFRQPTDVASEKFALALGADLIPLPSSDLVSALQTGLVEAGATVTLNYLWSGIADYAPNLTMTRHAYLVNALMVHKPWWDAEDAASRSRILAALPSATQFVARMRAAETRELQRAVAAGRVTSTEPSAEELAAWRALAPRVHEEIIEAVGARAPGVLLAVQPPPAPPARLR
jgi:TRAP-type C4-dicarboxylate transport system substrate-binding protein